jgi:hypothetical protein
MFNQLIYVVVNHYFQTRLFVILFKKKYTSLLLKGSLIVYVQIKKFRVARCFCIRSSILAYPLLFNEINSTVNYFQYYLC